MLQPGFNVGSIAGRRRNKSISPYKYGDVARTILEVLRHAERPLTSREIAELLWRKAGVSEPTTKQIRDMCGGVNNALRHRQGKTVEVVGEGIPARWRLKSEKLL